MGNTGDQLWPNIREQLPTLINKYGIVIKLELFLNTISFISVYHILQNWPRFLHIWFIFSQFIWIEFYFCAQKDILEFNSFL